MTDDRLKILLGFARFFLGTFALALVTLLVNREIQKREIDLKEQEQIGKFLDQALDINVEARLRFAQYFSNVTRSDELRKRWDEYYKVVKAEYEDRKKEKQELEDRAKKPGLDSTERIQLSSRIAELEQDLKSTSQQLSVQPPLRDYRIGIYCLTGNKEAKSIADKVASIIRNKVASIQVYQKGLTFFDFNVPPD